VTTIDCRCGTASHHRPRQQQYKAGHCDVCDLSLLTGVEVNLQVWLKQPLVDLAEITVRHDIVETFTSDPTLRESLRDQHLRGVPCFRILHH